jgi:CRP-like cAMP-binding protein
VSRPYSPAVLEAFDTFCKYLESDQSIPVEERMKAALAEILAPKHELLRRRAETIAQPIAERHGVGLGELFARSKRRDVVAARDALCGELIARGWTQADVGRVLRVSAAGVSYMAGRRRASGEAKEGKRSHG